MVVGMPPPGSIQTKKNNPKLRMLGETDPNMVGDVEAHRQVNLSELQSLLA